MPVSSAFVLICVVDTESRRMQSKSFLFMQAVLFFCCQRKRHEVFSQIFPAVIAFVWAVKARYHVFLLIIQAFDDNVILIVPVKYKLYVGCHAYLPGAVPQMLYFCCREMAVHAV